MGHDGPAHLAISERRPLLRGLGVYHGKRGYGVSVEFDVAHGPVTALGLTQLRDGRSGWSPPRATVVAGPLLEIGNTTSRVDFGRDPGEWCDAWSGNRGQPPLGARDRAPRRRASRASATCFESSW